ncbi:NAD(P)/FAD-dependent oxidoreductase [uncultured Anaerococcus sp.]|uniref:NAD(P)/FAD-dependent oxidoreductase n=1 Tax=uncultured Anaerococcus sp. TaxID=293428 RepID=UPI0025E619C6|nr:NAD(P)/FAD-dependent oxidoreductase [uncultured Anaerococcus sp.]
MTYDIAIIGAGPAGLSAALNSKIRNKKVILFGKDSEKLVKTEKISNYLGLKDISGKALNDAFNDSLLDYDLERSFKKVRTVYAMGDYFAIEVENESEMIEAKSVILATGIDLKKELVNEDKFFANGVNYCATCDAALYREKKVVVIGYNEEAIEEANFTSEIVGSLVFVNMTGGPVSLNPGIDVIEGEIPRGFEGEKRAEVLVFKSGKSIEADGFFIIKDASRADRLVPSIKMEENHIRVDKNMESSIRGLFAAGDTTGSPYQIMKAVGEGQVAALSAASFLAKK